MKKTYTTDYVKTLIECFRDVEAAGITTHRELMNHETLHERLWLALYNYIMRVATRKAGNIALLDALAQVGEDAEFWRSECLYHLFDHYRGSRHAGQVRLDRILEVPSAEARTSCVSKMCENFLIDTLRKCRPVQSLEEELYEDGSVTLGERLKDRMDLEADYLCSDTANRLGQAVLDALWDHPDRLVAFAAYLDNGIKCPSNQLIQELRDSSVSQAKQAALSVFQELQVDTSRFTQMNCTKDQRITSMIQKGPKEVSRACNRARNDLCQLHAVKACR